MHIHLLAAALHARNALESFWNSGAPLALALATLAALGLSSLIQRRRDREPSDY